MKSLKCLDLWVQTRQDARSVTNAAHARGNKSGLDRACEERNLDRAGGFAGDRTALLVVRILTYPASAAIRFVWLAGIGSKAVPHG